MFKNFAKSTLVFFPLILILTGCTKVSPEVQRTFSDARAHFDVVESLEVRDTFPDDYREARNKLVEAQNYLNSSYGQNNALLPAQQSLRASQRILRDFYQNTITPLARKAKAEIERIAEEDPDNPLKDFLPTLDELLEYSEKLENEEEIIALNRVIEDLNEVITIKDNADKNIKTTLESDISFASGQYELSEKGKQFLKKFFEQVIVQKQGYLDLYSGAAMTMKIKVVGYTDQQGFKEGTKLVRTLREGVESQVPLQPVDQRRFLNQRLSQLRAQTIGNYIRLLVEQADSQIYIEQDIVGRGEEIPPGIDVIYSTSDSVADPQRRVCKIYTYIMVQ